MPDHKPETSVDPKAEPTARRKRLIPNSSLPFGNGANNHQKASLILR
jgi:hypothetical protein